MLGLNSDHYDLWPLKIHTLISTHDTIYPGGGAVEGIYEGRTALVFLVVSTFSETWWQFTANKASETETLRPASHWRVQNACCWRDHDGTCAPAQLSGSSLPLCRESQRAYCCGHCRVLDQFHIR